MEVIQLAAFLNQGSVARLGVHGLGSAQATNLFANDDQQGQTVLPDQLVSGSASGANVARATINPTAPFGIYISVDPTLGGGAFDLDTFTIDRANVAPSVAEPLAAQTATQGQAFSYTMPAGTFSDVDGDALTYSVTGLPAGLAFNAATRAISGTPTASGALTLQVSASDGSASASTPLALTVAPGSVVAQSRSGGRSRPSRPVAWFSTPRTMTRAGKATPTTTRPACRAAAPAAARAARSSRPRAATSAGSRRASGSNTPSTCRRPALTS